MKKHVILFLATNPTNTNRLALDREARAIDVELSRSGYRDCFELVTRWAAEPLDLLRELRRLKPTVIHFSGNDKRSVARSFRYIRKACRGASDEKRGSEIIGPDGMCFRRADGGAQFVSAVALGLTFAAIGACIKLVVFNTCCDEILVDSMISYTDCIISMCSSIHDEAARDFAIGFYGALGDRESVAAAYEQGCAAISLGKTSNRDRPRLWVRDGIDARQIVLAARRHRRRTRNAGTHV